MRHALAVATLALVAGATAGCGASGPPTDASEKDFCGVFEDFYAEMGEMGADASTSDGIKALKKVAEELKEVGTPEDISDDAREGFELTIEAIESIEDDATEEEIGKLLEEDFSKEEQEKADAFDEYLEKTCDNS